MMMRMLLMAGLVLCFALSAYAETDTVTQTVGLQVNEVAEIAVSGDVASLAIDNPAAGGIPPDDSDATTYLTYTSVVGAGRTRTVDAAVTAGTVPAGCDLYVTADTPGASGAGAKGSTGGEKNLENSATGLVTGIGSCWTGTDVGDGSNLTFRLTVDPAEVGDLVTAAAGDVTVTWTMNDDSL